MFRLTVLAIVFAAALAPDAAAPLGSTQVKAAFVLNFLKFVEWTAVRRDAADAPVAITVLDDPAIEAELQRIAGGARVGERPVVIRHVTTAADAADAHVLFIGASRAPNLAVILRALENRPVLTVGDTPGFAEAGVMLNLYEIDRRVRIEVNATAAARAQLHLSAHLLRIARIVG